MLSYSLAAGAMGKNGLLRFGIKMLGSSSAVSKRIGIYADATLLYQYVVGTSIVCDFEAVIQNIGTLSGQMATRTNLQLGASSRSLVGDISAFDFGANCTLAIITGIAANTDTVMAIPRFLNMQAKA